MSNDGHTYSFPAPATGWLEFAEDGHVVRAERPSESEFADDDEDDEG